MWGDKYGEFLVRCSADQAISGISVVFDLLGVCVIIACVIIAWWVGSALHCAPPGLGIVPVGPWLESTKNQTRTDSRWPGLWALTSRGYRAWMPSIWSSLVELFGTITVQRLNSSWWKNIRYNIVPVTKFFSHAVHGNACYSENIDTQCRSATAFFCRLIFRGEIGPFLRMIPNCLQL
jgi:hypothetical protein